MVLNNFNHNNNTEEEYYWDDYDLKLTSKHVTIKQRHIPKMTNVSVSKYLHRNEKIKILISNTSEASTQTTEPSTCDDSSQTFPKFYFPRPKSNFNFEPFNTNIIF